MHCFQSTARTPRTSLLSPVAIAVALALLLALTLGPGAGCTTSSRAPANLPDDINAVFLDQEMDVGQFIERFEGESRAVYAQRFAIVEALKLSPGDVVADIGAGTGFFSFLISERVTNAGRTYAVEISPRFLEHLRARKAERAIENLEVVEATARSVSLPTASIDLGFVCDVYHHFEHPGDSLASLRDAIRPGGSLVLIEFHRIPGVTNEFIFNHVRAGREVFQAEIEAAGFRFVDEIELEGLDDNYILRFERM